MPRIAFPKPEMMTPDQRRVYDAVIAGPRGVVQGPLLAALHRPELADKWQQLGELLRFRTSLPPYLTELAILVTARAWDCRFEWYAHEPVAAQAGVPLATIAAIRTSVRPDFAAYEAADEAEEVYDFSIELQSSKTVSADAYARVIKRWGTVGVVELTAVIGYYTMVAMTLNAHEFALPEGSADPFASPVQTSGLRQTAHNV